MKRFLVELGAQLAGLVIIGFSVGITALIFGASVGGSAIGVAPEWHVRLLGGFGWFAQKATRSRFMKAGG